MGTWNRTPFGNDTALDWLASLEEASDGPGFIEAAIDSVLNDYDGDSDIAEEGLAAASLIFGATNFPVKGTNAGAKTWIERVGYNVSSELVEKAIRAIDVITTESDLAALWKEADGYKGWLSSSDKLRGSLEAAIGVELPSRSPKKRGMPRSLYKLVEFYEETKNPVAKKRIAAKIDAMTDVNEATSDTDFIPPLALMCKHGLLDEVNALIGRGADPNAESFAGQAFPLAIAHGHIDVAEVLIEAGVELFGETVMDLRTGYGYNPEIYEGAEEKPILKTYRYCVALFTAARSGSPEIIDYILSKGADVHQIDLNGETLIHKACEGQNVSTLKHLIELGVDLDACKGIVNSNPNSCGEAALHYAVSSGNVETVRLLLESGANVNVVEYFEGQEHRWRNTPLDLANDSPNSNLYQLLVSHGATLAAELGQ